MPLRFPFKKKKKNDEIPLRDYQEQLALHMLAKRSFIICFPLKSRVRSTALRNGHWTMGREAENSGEEYSAGLDLPEGGAAGSKQPEGRVDHSPRGTNVSGPGPFPRKEQEPHKWPCPIPSEGQPGHRSSTKARLGCLSCVVFC